MNSICGADCEKCAFGSSEGCKGCAETGGCPFGKTCSVAGYIAVGGMKFYEEFVKKLTCEINALRVPGMPEIAKLVPVNGSFVNLEYTLPNGRKARLLDDDEIYLGAQAECEFADSVKPRYFGAVANGDFLLVSEYGVDGSDPQIIVFQKR